MRLLRTAISFRWEKFSIVIRHVYASHWNSSKLTLFNRYYDQDSELSSSKYPLNCVNLLGLQWLAQTCRFHCRTFLLGQLCKFSLVFQLCRIFTGMNNNTDQTCSCLREWRLSGHYRGPLRTPWNPQYITAVYRIEKFKGVPSLGHPFSMVQTLCSLVVF